MRYPQAFATQLAQAAKYERRIRRTARRLKLMSDAHIVRDFMLTHTIPTRAEQDALFNAICPEISSDYEAELQLANVYKVQGEKVWRFPEDASVPTPVSKKVSKREKATLYKELEKWRAGARAHNAVWAGKDWGVKYLIDEDKPPAHLVFTEDEP